jgi:glucose dehydrogenase
LPAAVLRIILRRMGIRRGPFASFTYMGRDGKQYVVVPAGGGGFLRSPTGDAVVAFALPDKGKAER